MKIHIVKKGETLGMIAQKYQISLETLLAANPQISNPDQIAAGSKIKIPAGPVMLVEPPAEHVIYKHTVKQGDTLWQLSKTWGVPLQALIHFNPQLKNPNVLLTGETVYIPKFGTDTPHSAPVGPGQTAGTGMGPGTLPGVPGGSTGMGNPAPDPGIGAPAVQAASSVSFSSSHVENPLPAQAENAKMKDYPGLAPMDGKDPTPETEKMQQQAEDLFKQIPVPSIPVSVHTEGGAQGQMPGAGGMPYGQSYYATYPFPYQPAGTGASAGVSPSSSIPAGGVSDSIYPTWLPEGTSASQAAQVPWLPAYPGAWSMPQSQMPYGGYPGPGAGGMPGTSAWPGMPPAQESGWSPFAGNPGGTAGVPGNYGWGYPAGYQGQIPSLYSYTTPYVNMFGTPAARAQGDCGCGGTGAPGMNLPYSLPQQTAQVKEAGPALAEEKPVQPAKPKRKAAKPSGAGSGKRSEAASRSRRESAKPKNSTPWTNLFR